MNNQETQNKLKIANPGARFVAYTIDTLIGIAILELFILSVISTSELETLLNNLLKTLIFLIFFFSIVTPLINSLLISKLGGTLGKLLTGIRIVNEKGQNLSFLRAFFRNHIGYLVSKSFLMLGFIWILTDKQRRAWHDLITGSLVIVRNRFALFIGLSAMAILLIFDIFLGQTTCLRLNQNRSFYRNIFNDVVDEIRDTMSKQVPSEPAPIPAPTTSSDKTINFGVCKKGEGYRENVPLGSTYLTIKESKDSICEIEISNEVEGGYIVYSCKIPKSIGTITFKTHNEGSDFSPIEQYCKEIKSGNVFWELKEEID